MNTSTLALFLPIACCVVGSCSICHEPQPMPTHYDKFLELRASAEHQNITAVSSDPRISRWRAECLQYLNCFVLRDLSEVQAIIGQPSRSMRIDDERQLLEFYVSNDAAFSLYVNKATVRGVFANRLDVLSRHVGPSNRE